MALFLPLPQRAHPLPVSTSCSPLPPRCRSAALKSGAARWRTASHPPAPPPGSPSVNGPIVPKSLARPLEVTLPLPPNLSVLSPPFQPAGALLSRLSVPISSVLAPAQTLFLAFPQTLRPRPHLTQFSASAPPEYTCSSSHPCFSPPLFLCICFSSF